MHKRVFYCSWASRLYTLHHYKEEDLVYSWTKCSYFYNCFHINCSFVCKCFLGIHIISSFWQSSHYEGRETLEKKGEKRSRPTEVILCPLSNSLIILRKRNLDHLNLNTFLENKECQRYQPTFEQLLNRIWCNLLNYICHQMINFSLQTIFACFGFKFCLQKKPILIISWHIFIPVIPPQSSQKVWFCWWWWWWKGVKKW